MNGGAAMKAILGVSNLAWAGMVLVSLAAAPASAQDAAATVGWGSQVVVPPTAMTDLVAVAAGGWHCLGLKDDGSIVAWGRNNYGQCNVPAPNSGFVGVAGGEDHGLGLKANGSIAAWGDNHYGQRNVPAPNGGFVAVAGGANHSLGMKANGSIVAWGYNGSGQCNVPAPNSSFV